MLNTRSVGPAAWCVRLVPATAVAALASMSLPLACGGTIARIGGSRGDDGSATTGGRLPETGVTQNDGADGVPAREGSIIDAAVPDAGAPTFTADAVAESNTDGDAAEDGLLPQLPAPTFNPPSGAGQPSVAIDEPLPNFASIGGIILYTTDGTSPGPTNGRMYTGPFPLGGCGGGTVEAVASAPGYRTSAVARADYPGEGVLARVVFQPAGTTADNDFGVSLAVGGCGVSSATICYTLDGVTSPTCDPQGVCSGASQTYSSASLVPINGSVTSAVGAVAVQALACAAGSSTTTVERQDYVLQVSAPSMAMPAPGALPHQAIGYTPTVASSTAGASIRFTTDGSMPTCTTGQSPQPTAPGVTNPGLIAVSQSETINAIACKPGYAPSSVSVSAYILQ
jgi:hypothetical protein